MVIFLFLFLFAASTMANDEKSGLLYADNSPYIVMLLFVLSFTITVFYLRKKISDTQNKLFNMEEKLDIENIHLMTTEKALEQSQSTLDTLMTNLPGVIYQKKLDVTYSMLYLSDGILALTGHSPSDFISGKINFIDLIHPDDLLRYKNTLDKSIQDHENFQVQYRITSSDGKLKWLWEQGKCSRNQDKNGYIFEGFISDFTQQKNAEERIEYLAFHDSLTGLPNRLMFNEELQKAIEASKTTNEIMGILYLDLDNFKNVNERLGHHVGDEFINKVTNRLLRWAKPEDVIARVGGDEFLIILKNAKSEFYVMERVKNILNLFAVPIIINDQKIFTTTSIGVTIFPNDGQDIDALITNADIALYKAKQHGKNSFQNYTSQMKSELIRKLSIETDLRHALKREEFLLYYQPKVDVKTLKIKGLEALIRWQHDGNWISPGEFIPVAEETGLIYPLGEWVLKHAITQAKLWHEQGYTDLNIAVNLSVQQFQLPNIVEIIENILSELQYDPGKLNLEITENIIMQKVEQGIETMKQLNAIGCHLSIDDFGTGYSSLNYLRRFPLSELKLDKTFIDDIPYHPDGIAIVNAITTLARNLKLNIVAEGVEELEQYDFLSQNRCDQIQGYFFSKPLPAKDITELLKTGIQLDN